jgi:hypothetical protein
MSLRDEIVEKERAASEPFFRHEQVYASEKQHEPAPRARRQLPARAPTDSADPNPGCACT